MAKLHKNKFIALVASSAIVLTLTNVSCRPKREQTNAESVSEIYNAYKEKPTKNEEIITKEEADLIIEEYVSNLKEEMIEISSYSKEKWQSDEVQEKVNFVKQKTKDLFDFIFNDKEINGITFNDLSDEGKEIAKNGLYEIDSYLELVIPDYKERFKDWTVDKGADAVELFNSLKEDYNNYKEEVMENYNSRRK